MISLSEYFMWLEAISSCALSGNKLAEKAWKEHEKAEKMYEKMLIIDKYAKQIEKAVDECSGS